MDNIKMFDYFGYTPQFLIEGQTKYKSFIGGIISLFFIMLSIIYSVLQFYTFFSNIDILNTSRNIVQPSYSYNLTTNDLYFGIGLMDRNKNELNISLLNYLKFEIQYFYTDKSTLNQYNSSLNFGPCNISKFLASNDYYNLTELEKNKIKKKIPFYLCPQGNFEFKFSASGIIEGDIYFQVLISITNSSFINIANNELSKNLIRTNFIYKNIFVDSENRKNPYKSFIDNSVNSLDFDYEKTFVTYLVPFEMADDNNLFGNGDFTGVQSDYSDQLNETIFLPTPGYSYFTHIKNRSEPIVSQNNSLVLSLCRLRMMLSPMMTITMRSYPKFTDFLAGLTSILSTGLMIIAIVIVHFNSVQGFNEMVESLYSHESIKNIRIFNTDLKKTINNHRLNSNSKLTIKLDDKRVESERISNSNYLNKESGINLVEMKKDIKLKTDHGKLCNEPRLSQSIFNDPIENEIELNSKLKRDSKLERIIEIFLEDNKKFSLIDYFKQKCKNQSKRIILYGYGLKNLTEILDIKNYLKNHLELNLVKEVLFDEFQLKIFNTISPLIGFKHIFEEHENKSINLSEYNRIEFNDFFDYVNRILTRKNMVDNIILDFIKKQLIKHS